jgi:hypothetical protein
VLRDWESTDAPKYNKVLDVHPFSECLTAPASLVNPELDESFVGIERFLDTALIVNTVPPKKLGLENALPGARYRIDRQSSAKPSLVAAVSGGTDPGPNIKELAHWLDDKVVVILDAVPAAEFS